MRYQARLHTAPQGCKLHFSFEKLRDFEIFPYALFSAVIDQCDEPQKNTEIISFKSIKHGEREENLTQKY